MDKEFDWDPHKDASNQRKHGVSFEEAATVFADPLALYVFDDAHSAGEERFHVIGLSIRRRILFVVHCERHDVLRIIIARRATRTEEADYAQGL